MKTKKVMLIVCCLVIGTLGLMMTGCGEKYADSQYLGTWTATTAEYAGLEIAVSDVIGGDFTFTLKDDGTCSINVADEKSTGEWEETDSGIKLFDDEGDMEFTGDGSEIVYEKDGMQFNFIKGEKNE